MSSPDSSQESSAMPQDTGRESAEHWRAVKAALKEQRQSPPMARVSREGPLPLSYAQKRLWFLGLLDPASAAYNVWMDHEIAGPLDIAALERSLNEIVRRHEVLRTTFSIVDGQPGQVIAPELTIGLPVIDLRHLPDGERDAEARRLADEEVSRPFDLPRGPLIRAALLRLEPERHILLLTVHHIVFDYWSVALFNRELAEFYTAFRAGECPTGAPSAIQYADFAAWQREWLSGPIRTRQLAYWTARLSGAPASLELPTDRPRPPVQTGRCGRQVLALPADLANSVRALGQEHGVTTFMILLAAYQILLARHARQEDILVGAPIADRSRPEINKLIGCFLNTLVFRTDLSGDPTMLDLLARVRAGALEAFANQNLPFDLLVEELHLERDLSRMPLFQAAFSFLNVSGEGLELPGLSTKRIDPERPAVRFDITLYLRDTPDGFTGFFEYAAELFEPETVARMAGHFETLLASVAAHPERRLSELSMLTVSERHQLLVDWNDTESDYPRDRCIHQIFEASARRNPDGVAVVFGDRRLTYRELDQRANQLAHYLQRLGAGPDVLVGIAVERSLEMIVGLLGILKAGGAYVPLDPAYPSERLTYMLSDSGVRILLTQERLLEPLPPLNPPLEQGGGKTSSQMGLERNLLFPSCSKEGLGEVLCLDRDWPLISQQPVTAPPTTVTAANLAYVIYTSGSTGRPKGVLVPHAGASNLAEAQLATFSIRPDARVLQFASLSFDASIFEIIMALRSGATLYLAPPEASLPGEALLRMLRDCKITNVTLAPSVLAALPKGDLPDLRTVIVAGEACPAELAAAWGAGRSFFNAYGPTETTVWATTAACTDTSLKPSIGRPIGNARVYVLDKHAQPVPVGVPGELVVGGAGITRGYLNRPDLTALAFIPDPFSTEPGARLYKTGDLARILPDGNIDFLGRIDHQVKIRGHRIELGEIEAALHRSSPNLREAAVLVREDIPGIKRLVAYLVFSDAEQPFSASEMRAALAARLPGYMIPAFYVVLPALPLTSNGKLDRAALPAPDGGRPDLEAAYAAPTTDAERILTAIWREVLRIEQVGIHDNFFSLGGDSILCIQVVTKAARAGLHITPNQMFQFQTIAGLAAVARTAGAVAAEQGLVTGEAPLTAIQRWFFELGLPSPNHFNQVMRFTARQRLNPELLKQAVGCVVPHHDALRLRFPGLQSTPLNPPLEQGGGKMESPLEQGDDFSNPVGISCSPSCSKEGVGGRCLGIQHSPPHEENNVFHPIDLSHLAPADQPAAIESAFAALQTGLNIATGPLIDVALVDLGIRQPQQLLITVHHLAMDGVSWRILLEDLLTAYEQLSLGQPVALPAKTTAFVQWAERLSRHAQSEEMASEVDYWLSRFWDHAEPIPVDFPGGDNTAASARRVWSELTVRETEDLLREVPAAYNTRIDDILLTALAQTLALWTGSPSVLIALEGHGREDLFSDVDLTRTVGWFTSLYPVVLNVGALAGPGDAVMSVKEQLRTVPNRGIGFGILRYLSEDSEIVRMLSALPSPQVIFNYLGQFDHLLPVDALLDAAPESLMLSQDPAGRRPHLLGILGRIVEGRLQIGWAYSESVHRRAAIEALADGFMMALRTLIDHCQSPDAGGYTPSDFPLSGLNQDDLNDLLAELDG